jgi:pimeloyl-ACP methyl ester carboxylesterase
LVALVVVVAALWRPALKPAGQATLLVGDIFSEQLIGTNFTQLLTPEPREEKTSDTFAGVSMRVDYWRPGWGDQHPAIVIIPGATPRGNDEAPMRQFGRTLARAGYMVMLPEFPFMKEGRFDPEATRQIDAAFTRARGLPDTRERSVGVFGVSVGAGMMLVAAGREPGISQAAFLAILGSYYDLDTYLASVVSHRQRSGAELVPWEPSQEAKDRLPPAAVDILPETHREEGRRALEPGTYEDVLRRVRELPPAARAVYDSVSPELVWASIKPPIYWIHDPLDTYEPLAEAEAAKAAPRSGRMVLVVPRLLAHTVPADLKGSEMLFIVRELWNLLSLTFEVLRIAG